MYHCPRCGVPLQQPFPYCPHCGMDLQRIRPTNPYAQPPAQGQGTGYPPQPQGGPAQPPPPQYSPTQGEPPQPPPPPQYPPQPPQYPPPPPPGPAGYRPSPPPRPAGYPQPSRTYAPPAVLRPIVILNAISCFVALVLFILLGSIFSRYMISAPYKYGFFLQGRNIILGIAGIGFLALCAGFLIRGIRYEEGFQRWAALILCSTAGIYGLYLLFCAVTYQYTFLFMRWGYMGSRIMTMVVPSVLCALLCASGIVMIIALLYRTPAPAVIVVGGLGILLLLITMLVFLVNVGSFATSASLYAVLSPASFGLLGTALLVAEAQQNRATMR